MIDDASETKTECSGGKEQVKQSEKKKGQQQMNGGKEQQVNSNVIAIRSI